MESVPPGNWYCLECVNSDKDSFGFVPAAQCSIEKFRRIDERAKKKWLGQSQSSAAHIEKRFWEIVEGRAGEVEVKYGSELDTSNYGSGFPRDGDAVPVSVDPNVWREYATSPWNLNNLPKLEGSLLRVVEDSITGVMVPWLYIGMLFSAFCWHIEDHCFYSINYLHWGDPKCWYGVPGSEAGAFEKVMRNTLPDLFDAQPDLLFQLVTMLSPSVLQESGVPVYRALQEPGNFIVTFPKSYHGGFNFGLNCAEAVNFASADWLPHGGFGAELYRLYHKAAVLSHEELLCVVAKNKCDSKILPYLKEEMHRIYAREKGCREELWRNDIVSSSLMPPKKHSTHVGTEEDPTCVICQQYLYLSAVTCSCRPSAFVCIEHWKHLCECNSSKRQLLYRHTLADLGDVVHASSTFGAICNSGNPESKYSQENRSFSNESSTLSKKVKGGSITYAQLAEDWLLSALRLFEISFSDAAFSNALKEAEQFLWAGHEMDPVRDMANKMVEAQKWSKDVRDCLSKLKNCLDFPNNLTEKVSLCELEELLSFDPLPCYEPGYIKLKAYVEEAKTLVVEIQSALSSCLDIVELENLHNRATGFPINLEETRILSQEISSTKVLVNSARECLSKKIPDSVDISLLKKLKSEMLETRIRLPELDFLLNLCKEADSWQARCKEVLTGPLKLKELEEFLRSADNVTVIIPELGLLRQYLADGLHWAAHLHNVLKNLKHREDHKNIVAELSCLFKSGELLRVQVDELPVVETELKRSRCRQKTLEALDTRMPLELIRQLLAEASLLEIESENLFVKISGVLTAATSWEERAKFVLGYTAHMSDFEDAVRTSEDIFALLPSLPSVKNAIAAAQSWVARSQPYLLSTKHQRVGKGSLLKVDDLKALVTQSKHLKVTLDDLPERLESLLNLAQSWEQSTWSLLEHSKSLLYIIDSELRMQDQLLWKIEELLEKINSAVEIGLSLGFEFNELPTLENTSLTLQWCLKSLSFCFKTPLLQEVDCLLDDAEHLPSQFSIHNLVEVLIRGTRWLRKALIALPEPQSPKKFKLKDIEEILEEIKESIIPYTLMVGLLRNAVEKHKSWLNQVHAFFTVCGQPLSLLVKLEEQGNSDAFDCPELQKVSFEIEKVEKWMRRCHSIVDPLVGEPCSLLVELVKIKGTIGRALCICRGTGTSEFCICWSNDSKKYEVYTCLTCEGRYHFSCVGPPLTIPGMLDGYACPFCLCMEGGEFFQNGGCTLIFRRNRPELKSIVELLQVSEDFCAGVEERHLLQEILKQALEFRTYLTELADSASFLGDKDLRYISELLLSALKAITVAGVYDHQNWCLLEESLSRNSWKIRVNKLLKELKKPSIQQLQGLLDEGVAIGIPSNDHFLKEVAKAKHTSLQWADTAKKVALDLGALELSEVFKLIIEGETLPVQFAEEMELLRERTVLYCICRKPYDQKAMIACDQCDEWYHFDCIDLDEPPPNTFLCPACKPVNGEVISLPCSLYNDERLSTGNEPITPPASHNEVSTDNEPPTPPASHDQVQIRYSKKVRSSLQQKMLGAVDLINLLRNHSEMDYLWRESRKPLQRTARKRCKFGSLSQIFDSRHVND